MLAVEPTTTTTTTEEPTWLEQAERDVRALQSIDLRILAYFAGLPADDFECWRTCDDVAIELRVSRQAIAWRPLGRLQALDLIEATHLIPLTGGRRMFRITARGAFADELIRNPSAASKESTRRHLRFVAPPEREPIVA